jgi:hypothetical protein
LRVTNRSGDRAKQRLLDEVDDYRKKLREQQRANKDLDDKYVRVKDCLYKTKSYLNRALDDVNDTLKRGQPTSCSDSKNGTANTTAAASKPSTQTTDSTKAETSKNAESKIETNTNKSGSVVVQDENSVSQSEVKNDVTENEPQNDVQSTDLFSENQDSIHFDPNPNENSNANNNEELMSEWNINGNFEENSDNN